MAKFIFLSFVLFAGSAQAQTPWLLECNRLFASMVQPEVRQAWGSQADIMIALLDAPDHFMTSDQLSEKLRRPEVRIVQIAEKMHHRDEDWVKMEAAKFAAHDSVQIVKITLRLTENGIKEAENMRAVREFTHFLSSMTVSYLIREMYPNKVYLLPPDDLKNRWLVSDLALLGYVETDRSQVRLTDLGRQIWERYQLFAKEF